MLKHVSELFKAHYFEDVVTFGLEWRESWLLADNPADFCFELSQNTEDRVLKENKDDDQERNNCENDHMVLANSFGIVVLCVVSWVVTNCF